MKKTFIVMAALVLGGATAKAQNLSYGVKVGIQQNSFISKAKSGDKAKIVSDGVGFHVGAFANYSLSDQFAVQPQLLFNSKSISDSKNDKTNVYAIDLPINLLYKHQGFFAGVGPNFSYGISAKAKSEDYETIDLYKKRDLMGTKVTLYKRFELGINGTLGYEFSSGFVLSANYMQGLTNVADYGSNNAKTNSRYVGLSIGYTLSGK